VTSEVEGIDDIPGRVFDNSSLSCGDGEVTTLKIVQYSNARESHQSAVLEIQLRYDRPGQRRTGQEGGGGESREKRASEGS
jgi:hypothetical protein